MGLKERVTKMYMVNNTIHNNFQKTIHCFYQIHIHKSRRKSKLHNNEVFCTNANTKIRHMKCFYTIRCKIRCKHQLKHQFRQNQFMSNCQDELLCYRRK